MEHRHRVFGTEFELFPPEVTSVLPTVSALDEASLLAERDFLVQR